MSIRLSINTSNPLDNTSNPLDNTSNPLDNTSNPLDNTSNPSEESSVSDLNSTSFPTDSPETTTNQVALEKFSTLKAFLSKILPPWKQSAVPITSGGQKYLVKIKDIASTLGITQDDVKSLSKKPGQLEKFIEADRVLNSQRHSQDVIKLIKGVVDGGRGLHVFQAIANQNMSVEDLKSVDESELKILTEFSKNEEHAKNLLKGLKNTTDPAIRNTILKAAEQVRSFPYETAWYGKAVKNGENKSYGYIVDENRMITIREKFIVQGSFKNVKAGTTIQTDDRVVNLIIKNKNMRKTYITEKEQKSRVYKEVKAEQTITPVLQKIKNTYGEDSRVLTPIKVTVESSKERDQAKFVMVADRMEGDATKFLGENVKKKLGLILDMAIGLQQLHEENLCHNDVKLANVLVDKKERGKIADFSMITPANGYRPGGTAGYFTMGKACAEEDTYAVGICLLQLISPVLFMKDDEKITAFLGVGRKVAVLAELSEDQEDQFFEQMQKNINKEKISGTEKEALYSALDLAKKMVSYDLEDRPSDAFIIHQLKAIIANIS